MCVATSTDTSYLVIYNQGKNSYSSAGFVDFDLSATHIEWIAFNCWYYACVEDLCYCQVRALVSWDQASRLCRNSGLPNAELMKPPEPKRRGDFETYRNLMGFLNSNHNGFGALWSGLSRNNESDDFSDERGKSYSWFHEYKRLDSHRRNTKKCVRKITSKGWAMDHCLERHAVRQNANDYEQLFKNETYDKYLQWEDIHDYNKSPAIFILSNVLCEYDVNSLEDDELDCVNKNTSGRFHIWETSVYYKKSLSYSSTPRDPEHICRSSVCFVKEDGHRAVINSKEEEKFILEQIDDIFLEIGLTASDDLENGGLVWDRNANGIPTDQLKWYYEGRKPDGPNCLASDPLSDSAYQIKWVARECSEDIGSVCTFTPPKLRKDEVAVTMRASLGAIRNPYYGYFCLDEKRSSCYALFFKRMCDLKNYIRKLNFKLAVVKDDYTKSRLALKIRPHSGVYVGASSMRLGNKYEWMYQEKFTEVKLNKTYEVPAIQRILNGYSKKICMMLASNGSFMATSCELHALTAFDVSDDRNFDFMQFEFSDEN